MECWVVEGRGDNRFSIGGLRKPMKSLRVLNRTCDFPNTQRECHSLSVSSLWEGMVTHLVKRRNRFLWNPVVYQFDLKSAPLGYIPGHINPGQIITTCLISILIIYFFLGQSLLRCFLPSVSRCGNTVQMRPRVDFSPRREPLLSTYPIREASTTPDLPY